MDNDNRATPSPGKAPEPVAVIGSGFSLVWIGNGPIAPIIKRNGLKVGDKLYASPGKAEAEDAARWRFWKNWWMHDSEGRCYHLPEAVISALEGLDLDGAMDAAMERDKH